MKVSLDRLVVGDIILDDRNWIITDTDFVLEPNVELKTDWFGQMYKEPSHVVRLKFDCIGGAWRGYIYPHIRKAVYVNYNGYSEYIVSINDIPEMVIISQNNNQSEKGV